MQAELILDARARLGEGPAWDAKTRTLYWVDILEKRVYAGERLLAQLDDFVGCLAPSANGHLLLGVRCFFVDLEPGSGERTVLAALESEPPGNRINDGKCDPAGRFLAGTMNLNEVDPSGSLYSFDGRQVERLVAGVTISNGLAWSPDHKTLYYIDTPTREVRAFDYDLETGRPTNPRPAVRIPAWLGWPDGMTSDREGNLWIAMWGGAQVTSWDPRSGRLLKQVRVPALQVSSCAFGGPGLSELYITSARKGMSAADLEKYPLSGGLFKAITETEGMPAYSFGG
jgi:sugar lactone lactonase YvrE